MLHLIIPRQEIRLSLIILWNACSPLTFPFLPRRTTIWHYPMHFVHQNTSSMSAENSPVLLTIASLEMKTTPSTQLVLNYSLNEWINGERPIANRGDTEWHLTCTKLGLSDYIYWGKDKEWLNWEKKKRRPGAPLTGTDCHSPRIRAVCPAKAAASLQKRKISIRTHKGRRHQGTTKQLWLKHSGWTLHSLDRKSVETLQAQLLSSVFTKVSHP